jgi:PAS domain S-box-containing protein
MSGPVSTAPLRPWGDDPGDAAAGLARLTGRLAASLDYEETLHRVATIAVPALADYCFFDLLEPDGSLRRIGWSHVDPDTRDELAELIRAAIPSTASEGHPLVRALRSGAVVVEPHPDETWRQAVARDGRHLEVLRRLDPTSAMFVPLVADGATVGVLTLATSVSGRAYGQEDVTAARELAAQAMVAIERSRLYGELEAQKRILEAQGDASPDGLLLVSPDDRVLSTNRRFSEIWGVAGWLAMAGTGESILAAAAERTRDPDAFLARVSLTNADPDAAGTDLVELLDGRILERVTTPVRSAAGEFIGRLWSFHDVTEGRRAEQALRYQIDLTTSILENAQAGLMLVDRRGYATYVNEAWVRMTGFSRQEMGARPAHEMFHQHHAGGTPFPSTECPLTRALPELRRVAPYEDVFVRKDGTFLPVRAAASPILREGEPEATIVEVEDVTGEEHAQAALREATAIDLDRAARLHALIGAMQEAVVVVEPDGSISIANPAARDLFGRTLGSFESVGRRLEDRSLRLWPLADGSVGPVVCQLRGEDRWVEIRGYGIERPGHEHGPAPAIFLFRDVTREQRAEALRDRFIEVLSHELRTPVTTIYGGSRLLARENLGREHARELITDMVAEADRLYRLIDNLVVLTKTREGALEVSSEPVLLGLVVDSVVQSERRRWPGVAFSVTCDRGAPPVEGDGTSVEQVVRNLVGNAAKYGDGHVEVRVERLAPRDVVVRIIDDGGGIPSDALTRVFDPFFRTDEAVRRASGAGIGLFVSKHLVEAMGGRIWASNRAEGGTEFDFVLPGVVEEG